jgi:hypothetical protein
MSSSKTFLSFQGLGPFHWWFWNFSPSKGTRVWSMGPWTIKPLYISNKGYLSSPNIVFPLRVFLYLRVLFAQEKHSDMHFSLENPMYIFNLQRIFVRRAKKMKMLPWLLAKIILSNHASTCNVLQSHVIIHW